MLKNRVWALFAVIAVIAGACKPKGPQTTESGLTYEIFRLNEDGTKIDSGMVAMVYFEQFIIKGTDTIDRRPVGESVPIPVGGNTDVIMEGLKMLHKGDSALLMCDAPKLFGGVENMPPQIPADAQLHFRFGVHDVLNQEQFQAYQAKKMEEMMAKQQARIAEQETTIKDYMTKNNMTGAQRTANGVHYVVTKAGKGKTPQPGDLLEVHYTGTLLNGEKFDSSVDRKETFEFPVGLGRVIPGWDEGFGALTEGTEATLIVPSDMAYGDRAAGPKIPANSILRFDVVFIKNKGASKPEGQ